MNGAQDPVSGMAPELEEARAIGELVRRGWRPKRSIVYTAWDGEEPGLLGSTEWVEHHASELRQKAVVYINTDGNGRGALSVGGSHPLETFINQVARDVEDPDAGVSVWKRWQSTIVATGTAEERNAARDRADLRIAALGSGSDYSPFLQHLGTPTLNLGFGGLDEDGIYHSIYDDIFHFTKFLDTDFRYGRALAQTVGTAVIRLADADLLPFEFTNLADAVQVYLTEVQQLLKTEQEAIAERNRQIEDGVFAAIADPRRPIKAPLVERLPPAINFAPLENASRSLARAAERFKKVAATARPRVAAHADVLQAVNARLDTERAAVDGRERTAAAALVPPPPLRARVLHRVRRQDAARRT